MSYVDEVLEKVVAKNPAEPEFHQAVKEVLESLRVVIEVNKPFELEGWKIYQLSYDESKGRWSDISVFELVRDPWLPVVYTGIWMMIAGAVCLFALSQKRKEDNV